MFMLQMRQGNLELTESDLKDFTETLNLAKPELKLTGEQATRFAKLAAIEDSVQRIREKVMDADDKTFELFSAALQTNSENWLQGRLGEAGARELLNMIGLTSEMAVRVFSGAAITQEEFDRFGNNFIGGLIGGKEALLGRLNNIETDFRTQRQQIINTAADPTAVNAGIGALDDLKLIQQAAAGDPAAEAEINRRPSAMELLEKMIEEQQKQFGGQGVLRAPPGGSYKAPRIGLLETIGGLQ